MSKNREEKVNDLVRDYKGIYLSSFIVELALKTDKQINEYYEDFYTQPLSGIVDSTEESIFPKETDVYLQE